LRKESPKNLVHPLPGSHHPDPVARLEHRVGAGHPVGVAPPHPGHHRPEPLAEAQIGEPDAERPIVGDEDPAEVDLAPVEGQLLLRRPAEGGDHRRHVARLAADHHQVAGSQHGVRGRDDDVLPGPMAAEDHPPAGASQEVGDRGAHHSRSGHHRGPVDELLRDEVGHLGGALVGPSPADPPVQVDGEDHAQHPEGVRHRIPDHRLRQGPVEAGAGGTVGLELEHRRQGGGVGEGAGEDARGEGAVQPE
jgi:hypothetical protein